MTKLICVNSFQICCIGSCASHNESQCFKFEYAKRQVDDDKILGFEWSIVPVADTYQKRTQDFYSELLKVQRKVVSHCWLVPLINALIDLDWWSLLGWMDAKDIIWSSKKLCFNYGLRNLAQWKLSISLQDSQELYQGLKTNKRIPEWLLSVEFWKDSGIVYWSGWTWRGKRLFWVMLIKRRLRFQFRSRSLEKNVCLHFTS